jgi:hypothetical protein
VSRRSLAVLLASCCLLLLAAPAYAERLTLRDPARDMWRTMPGGEVAPARWSETGDVSRVRVDHRRRVVVVKIDFVTVRRGGIYAQYAVRVQGTGEHRRIREVVLEAGPHNWRGKSRAFTGRGNLARGCDVGHRVDYKRDRVVVRLGRGCLGRPGSVRVNVNAYRANRKGVFFSDNPHDTTHHARAWSEWVRRSR